MKTRSRCAPPRLGLPVLFAVCAALAPAALASAQSVERDLFVSVLSRADEPVLSLGPADFLVREDGRTREVLRVRRATDPIDIALLVDTSQALGNQVADVRGGVESFVGRMGSQAHIAIVGLGDRPTILTDYTSDPAKLKKAVGMIFPMPGAGALVLEGIRDTLKGIATRTPERVAIIVVWAGGIELSTESDEPLLSDLERSGVALHALTIGTAAPADAMTQEGRSREIVFDRGTAKTGGRRQNVLSSMAMTDALNHLAAELLGQYRITYARPDTLIPPEKIGVTVRQDGFTVRATPVPARVPAR
ncbi:MAG: VWA domain-containing protein [Acidobacteria bacterium]|nr:VWA domain-containing protein [Acidobacteriota bacterium]